LRLVAAVDAEPRSRDAGVLCSRGVRHRILYRVSARRGGVDDALDSGALNRCQPT
jgi:hypothetical protein